MAENLEFLAERLLAFLYYRWKRPLEKTSKYTHSRFDLKTWNGILNSSELEWNPMLSQNY